MKNSNVVLTIFVPTYKRIHALHSTLIHLNSERAMHNSLEEIEIIVGSNSNEIELLKIESELNINLFVNYENIGITRNLLEGFQRSSGRYFWIFGDDDFIQCGLLTRIVSNLKAGQDRMLWIPSKSFIENKHLPTELGSIDYKEVFPTHRIDIHRYEPDSGFISSNIYPREGFERAVNSLEQFGLDKNNNYFIKAISFHVASFYQVYEVLGAKVYKRVSSGSHFTNDAKIIVKTFIEDLDEILYFFKNFSKPVFDYQYKRNKMRRREYFLLCQIEKNWRRKIIKAFVIYKNPFLIILFLLGRRLQFKLYCLYKIVLGKKVPDYIVSLSKYD